MKRWLMAVGENPVRIMRVAAQMQPAEIAAITTPETAYLVPEIEAACVALRIEATIRPVSGDAYRWDVTHAALSDLTQGEAASWQWVIAGGTKPMVAAQASAASGAPRGQIWSLDDAAAELRSWTGQTLRLERPDTNIPVRNLVRLHAGLDVTDDEQYPPPASPDDVAMSTIRQRLNAWTGQRGSRSRSRGQGRQLSAVDAERQRHHRNRVAEADYIALVRALLPREFDVYGGETVVLRDSADPRQPASNPFRVREDGRQYRTFEVDGVVVCGLDVWVLEYKNGGGKPMELRRHAAELDVRRRHLAGDGAIGILATLNKGADDDPEVEQPLSGLSFELGRTWHVDKPVLVEAAEMWLRGEGEASRLRGLFG